MEDSRSAGWSYHRGIAGRRLEVRGRESEIRKRRAGIEPAPSALARRRSGPLNYRRVFFFSSSPLLPLPPSSPLSPSPQWARLESNQYLRLFRPPLDLRAADPARPRAAAPHCARAADAPPVGLAPTASCVTSKRSGCLSYGGVRCVFDCQRTLTQSAQRRVKDSNLRSTSLRMPP